MGISSALRPQQQHSAVHSICRTQWDYFAGLVEQAKRSLELAFSLSPKNLQQLPRETEAPP
jgi:hypothetical protein